jgi:enterochelin esterase-like enzyme
MGAGGGVSLALASDEVSFRVDDPDRRLRAIRLVDDLSKRLPRRSFVLRPGSNVWELHLPRPPVERMEYLLELEHRDGRRELVPDPGNPLRAPGVFGEKSVREFPEYQAPAWLEDTEAPSGAVRRIRLRSRTLRAAVKVLLWSSAEAKPREPLPLLVVHDGPQYADYALLLRYLDFSVAEKELPPMRAALLAPVDRDQHYSASGLYAAVLTRELVPALERLAPALAGYGARVGMGASLGALAMLHAHRSHPPAFGGLFLQSGSFFRRRSDPQESHFAPFGRITRFIGRVVQTRTWPEAIPVTLTCGLAEENLANNEAMAAALAAQGYPALLHEHPDAHNWVSWRDTFDPHLAELLQRVWG